MSQRIIVYAQTIVPNVNATHVTISDIDVELIDSSEPTIIYVPPTPAAPFLKESDDTKIRED